MYTRVTKVKVKRGLVQDAGNVINGLRERIEALEGVEQFLVIMDEDRDGYVITVLKNRAESDANEAMFAHLWSHIAPFVEGPPETKGYDVMLNWPSKDS